MSQGRGSAARIGVRLRDALGGREIRELQRALEAEGVENSTYSSVYRYVKGRVAPPLPWLEAAAAVLGVSVVWLAFGDGPKRVDDAATSRRAGPIEASVYAEATSEDAPAGQAMVGALLDRVLDGLAGDVAELTDDQIGALLDGLLSPIYRIWYALRPESSDDRFELAGYLQSALSTLILATPPRGGGRPLGQLMAILQDREDDTDATIYMTGGHTVATIGAMARAHNAASAPEATERDEPV